MTVALPPLPYALNALAPAMSDRTVSLHYDKHHRGYVDRLNKLTSTTPMAQMPLREIVASSWGNPQAAAIFDNAAQVLNHKIFWRSLSPLGGAHAIGALRHHIDANFGSYDKFESAFVETAVSHFGSGWAWLIYDAGRLRIVTTKDAVTPSVLGLYPVLACDVWEHAYYLDYQYDREKYVRNFLTHLANWDFVEQQIAVARAPPVNVARTMLQPTEKDK